MVKKRQQDAHEDGSSTDSCEEEQNGPVSAVSSCQHVKKAVDTARLRRQLKTTGLLYECSQCQKLGHTTAAVHGDFEYDNTLWLCLKCGTQLCGRARNQHALQHHKTPHSDSHALTMNTRSFEIWCYDCDNEVGANTRKNLLECVELVKRLAQKPPANVREPAASVAASPTDVPPGAQPTIQNIEYKIKSTLEQIGSIVPMTGGSFDDMNRVRRGLVIPVPPPLPPSSAAAAVPGMAKRVEFSNAVASSANQPHGSNLERLARVRGLTNMGNTCFFNAVMQCLAQTPFLLSVLKELAEPGEEFVLPGGRFSFKEKGDIDLPMIKGTLSPWGGLTAALANALEELQAGGSVFTPSKLFDKLCNKCPQFTGGDQHDAHELLRQLLESVRSEDLKRYQRVILQNLGYKDQDISSVSEEMRQKCKIYGNQAADRILRPEQVFRGFLVSTLTCQDCFNVSSRHEYFLDMSLPVAVEKPQPPQRRKNSTEASPTAINTRLSLGGAAEMAFGPPSFFLHPDQQQDGLGQTKAQVKKDKERERKMKRAAKQQRNKQAQKLALRLNGNGDFNADAVGAVGGAGNGKAEIEGSADVAWQAGGGGSGGSGGGDAIGNELAAPNDAVPWVENAREDTPSSSNTSEHSDADVEDNLLEDTVSAGGKRSCSSTGAVAAPTGPTGPTAPSASGSGGAPTYYTDSNGNTQQVSEKRDDTPEHMDKDSLEEDENDSGIATSPAPTTNSATVNNNNAGVNGAAADAPAASMVSAGLSEKGAFLIRQISIVGEQGPAVGTLTNGDASVPITAQMEQLQLYECGQGSGSGGGSSKRARTHSYSDWSTTIAPRYQCEDGECSVQSCLNNFTAVELMTGQNKVGCESCTRRINGDDPQAKTVNTNATKQLLISSPPAVLILHLKRFQLGPRCIFRKLTRTVTYPMLLDIAPFCGSKVKNLPNIDRKQKKLLYALYGVVEHSGGMYGGHYTAYVKVRPEVTPDDKRWKFLPHGSRAELDQDDDQLKKLQELLAKEKARELRINAMDDSDDFTNSSSNSSGSDEAPPEGNEAPETATAAVGADDEAANVEAPPGKWYYVSDSRVQEVGEEMALKAQAYLLFYERIY